MKYQIGDEVSVKVSGESGVITDRMFSEAKNIYIYAIKPNDGGRSILRKEDDLEPYMTAPEYALAAEVADGVVVAVIYEVIDGNRVEVCREHAHILHDGVEGIAQAYSYATKKLFSKVDTGIYYKQRKCQ